MTISCCIITKNEEQNISECINSVINVVDEIIVLDTGSTDRTIQIASKFDKVKVFQTTWKDDFSLARNECISYAKYEWILSIDADERLICNIDLNEYTKQLNDFDIVNFKVIGYNKTFSKNFFTRALFKNNSEIKFNGLVHEYLVSKNKLNHICTDKFILKHNGTDSIDKSNYYLKLLNKAISLDKNNFHYYKHIANEYNTLNKFDLSISYYQEYLNKVKDESAHISLIVLLIDKKNDYKKALKYSEDLIKISNNIEAIFYKAYCYLNLKDYKKSINVFRTLLETETNSELRKEIVYKSYFGIGLSYLKLKDENKSLRYFHLAKEIINTKEVNNYISQLGVLKR